MNLVVGRRKGQSLDDLFKQGQAFDLVDLLTLWRHVAFKRKALKQGAAEAMDRLDIKALGQAKRLGEQQPGQIKLGHCWRAIQQTVQPLAQRLIVQLRPQP